jgi:hypothetical protein
MAPKKKTKETKETKITKETKETKETKGKEGEEMEDYGECYDPKYVINYDEDEIIGVKGEFAWFISSNSKENWDLVMSKKIEGTDSGKFKYLIKKYIINFPKIFFIVKMKNILVGQKYS